MTYTLSGNFGSANMSVQFSPNGGATWGVVPQSGSLSGDWGTGITSGNRTITWTASQQLSASTFHQNFHVRLVATSGSASVTNSYGPFTVDLRGLQGGLTVKGRVLHRTFRTPLPFATVSAGGQSTVSQADGNFTLTGVALAQNGTLTASLPGYATYSGAVPMPAGGTLVTLGDILLSPLTAANTNKPIVTKLEPKLKGLFLDGVHLPNEFTASVNWNGTTPGYVVFFANDLAVATNFGLGPDRYTTTIDMAGESFVPSFDMSANKVRVNAVPNGGTGSDPEYCYLRIAPAPPLVSSVLQQWPFTTYLETHVGADFVLPNPPIHWENPLDIIGKFGIDVQAEVLLDYDLASSQFKIFVGSQTTNAAWRDAVYQPVGRPSKIYLGQTELTGKIGGQWEGNYVFGELPRFDKFSLVGSIKGTLEIGRVGVLDVIGPGSTTAAGYIPGLSGLLDNISLVIYAKPGIEGSLNLALDPQIAFENIELTGSIGLEAAYEPDFGFCKARFYVGGEPSATFQFPFSSLSEFVKELRFRAYAGAQFRAWFFTFGPVEYVFLDVSYPSGPSLKAWFPSSQTPASRIGKYAVVTTAGLQTMLRSYLQAGPERFVANASRVKAALANDDAGDPLAGFRLLGQSPVKGSVMAGSSKRTKGFAGLSGTNQVDLTLVQNAFPNSEPAMDARGAELMLLYVTDNGISNNLQFTDIKWTRWDGTNWSAPLAIRTNTQAEFAPQLKYDGNADAIAVWERVADSNFNQTNLTAMAEQMEIVWSRWSRTNGTWSEPVAVTTNRVLDRAPLLCGPMTNGDLLLAWTRNESNLLLGTNAPGADTVLWSRWSALDKNWSVPSVLVSNLSYRLSQSLAGVSDYAVYAWTKDVDGTLTNDADQEVFYAEYAWRRLERGKAIHQRQRGGQERAGGGGGGWHGLLDLAERRGLGHEPGLCRHTGHSAFGLADRWLRGLRPDAGTPGALGPALAGNEHKRLGRAFHCVRSGFGHLGQGHAALCRPGTGTVVRARLGQCRQSHSGLQQGRDVQDEQDRLAGRRRYGDDHKRAAARPGGLAGDEAGAGKGSWRWQRAILA